VAAKGSTTKHKHKRTIKEKVPSTLGESDTHAQSSNRLYHDEAHNGDNSLSQPSPKDADSEKSVQKV
jgi:hypothetical protein